MKILAAQFANWQAALDDFQKSVEKDLEEIRRCKREVRQMKFDLIDQLGKGRYIRDEHRVIISAPEIIIGNVDRTRRSSSPIPKRQGPVSSFRKFPILNKKGSSPMKRRTFISLMSVMAAAGVLSLAGCSSNTSASTASSTAASASAAAANKLETIQSNGKLVIALEGAWQPWSFHDESDTLVGYDVEVSRAIAEKLGVEPEYVESDWDSLFAGLDAGRYDLVCNGVEVTEERAKTYDFTTPYG